MDSTNNKTNEKLNFVTQDKEFLKNYHWREMALSDWTTGINTAIEKKIEIAKIYCVWAVVRTNTRNYRSGY